MSKLKLFTFFIIAIAAIITGGCSEEDPIAPGTHFNPYGIVFRDEAKTVFMKIFEGVADPAKNTEFTAPLGDISEGFTASFLDSEGKETAPPEGKVFAFVIDDPSVAEVWQHEGEEGDYEFHLRGLKEGETFIEFKVMHNDHSDYRSGKIKVKAIPDPDGE